MGAFSAETQLGAPLAIVALLGVVQLGLGYYLFTKGVARVPAAQAAMLGLLEPVLNPVWAFLAAHESPTPWAVAGGIVILASVTLMSLRKE
jgi:drug/metabolite transporter (DMT)-like permease